MFDDQVGTFYKANCMIDQSETLTNRLVRVLLVETTLRTA